MKKETKELIEWIKKQIRISGETCVQNPNEDWVGIRNKAYKFLDSIVEIESHLCRGGYIQDENGTPCCDGDRIIYDKNYEGFLRWDKNKARFYIASIYGDYTFDKIKSFVKYKG